MALARVERILALFGACHHFVVQRNNHVKLIVALQYKPDRFTA